MYMHMLLCVWGGGGKRITAVVFGEGNVPECLQSPVLLVSAQSSPLPTQKCHTCHRIEAWIQSLQCCQNSCSREWFSSRISRKMCLESLQKGKSEVFQVNVNVGTWVWDSVGLRRLGSLVSAAEVLLAPWRSTETLASVYCLDKIEHLCPKDIKKGQFTAVHCILSSTNIWETHRNRQIYRRW